MKPLILILAAEIAGPSTAWIQQHAPFFLSPGHDVVATQSPTLEQIRAAYAILIPESQSYFAIIGRATGKNIVFLDAGIDGRDFVPGGTHVRQTLHMCDHLLGIAIGIAKSERAAAESLRAELAAKDADIARLNALVIAIKATWEQKNPAVEEADAPASPAVAAKIESEAGREIALAGGTLPDLATDAAKDGFASVEAPVDSSPPEPDAVLSHPVREIALAGREIHDGGIAEAAAAPVTSSVEPAGVKKTIRDIRRKPASE